MSDWERNRRKYKYFQYLATRTVEKYASPYGLIKKHPSVAKIAATRRVWEQIGDVLWERERVEQKRATFAEMDEAFDDIMTRYRVGRACIDQTGMGEKVTEDAQRRYGSRVEGVLFTGPNKLVMATRGKERFEDRTVRISQGDPKLRSDLHKLRKVASATGAPRFVAERDDDHADRTWAAFLGIHAADGLVGEYGYQPVPASKNRNSEQQGGDEQPYRMSSLRNRRGGY